MHLLLRLQKILRTVIAALPCRKTRKLVGFGLWLLRWYCFCASIPTAHPCVSTSTAYPCVTRSSCRGPCRISNSILGKHRTSKVDAEQSTGKRKTSRQMNKQQPLCMSQFLHRLFGFNVCFFFLLVFCGQSIRCCQVTWLGRVTWKVVVNTLDP